MRALTKSEFEDLLFQVDFAILEVEEFWRERHPVIVDRYADWMRKPGISNRRDFEQAEESVIWSERETIKIKSIRFTMPNDGGSYRILRTLKALLAFRDGLVSQRAGLLRERQVATRPSSGSARWIQSHQRQLASANA